MQARGDAQAEDAGNRTAGRAARTCRSQCGGSDDLDELIERVKQLRRESDRADEPFQIQVISAEGFSVDGVRRLEDKGVTDVIVGFRWPYVVGADTEPLADKIGALERFAETTIAACR